MISKCHFTTEKKTFLKKGRREVGRVEEKKKGRKNDVKKVKKKFFFKFLKNNDLLGISST